MKKLTALLLCALLLAGALSACGGGGETPAEPVESGSAGAEAPGYDLPEESAPSEDGVLRLMWKAQIGTDSIFESPWRDLQCLYPYMVFEPLFNYEADGTITYKLADAHTVSEDGLTYTFTVREGAAWQDGTPVSAEDVAFSFWGTLADPLASYKSGLSYIEGASAVTEDGAAELAGVSVEGNTVTVKLEKAYSLFVSAVAKMFILPSHILGELDPEELSTNEEYWKKPVGTGAYAIDEVSFPDYCTLVPNEGYWGAPGGVEKVLLTSYDTGGADAVTNALIAGELDFAYGNEVNDITVATSVNSVNSDVAILEMTSNYQRQFLFNFVESADGNLHPDLAKKEVRQALNMLLDKQALAELYGSNATALTSHLNPQSLLYNTDLQVFERDVEGATALLEGAGFDFDHSFRIAYYYDDQTTLDAMDLIVQNLAEGGITAESFLLSGDLATLIYADRNYDMLYCGESADDPAQMYFYLLGVGGYFDDIVGDMDTRQTLFNALIDQYNASDDAAEQKELAFQLQANGVDFCGIAPVVGINTLALYNQANLSIPTEIFEVDWSTRNWRFEDWSLQG